MLTASAGGEGLRSGQNRLGWKTAPQPRPERWRQQQGGQAGPPPAPGTAPPSSRYGSRLPEVSHRGWPSRSCHGAGVQSAIPPCQPCQRASHASTRPCGSVGKVSLEKMRLACRCFRSEPAGKPGPGPDAVLSCIPAPRCGCYARATISARSHRVDRSPQPVQGTREPGPGSALAERAVPGTKHPGTQPQEATEGSRSLAAHGWSLRGSQHMVASHPTYPAAASLEGCFCRTYRNPRGAQQGLESREGPHRKRGEEITHHEGGREGENRAAVGQPRRDGRLPAAPRRVRGSRGGSC